MVEFENLPNVVDDERAFHCSMPVRRLKRPELSTFFLLRAAK